MTGWNRRAKTPKLLPSCPRLVHAVTNAPSGPNATPTFCCSDSVTVLSLNSSPMADASTSKRWANRSQPLPAPSQVTRKSPSGSEATLECHWVPAAVELATVSAPSGVTPPAEEASRRTYTSKGSKAGSGAPLQVTTQPVPDAATDGQVWRPAVASLTRTSPPSATAKAEY